jgi:hypothetical protein
MIESVDCVEKRWATERVQRVNQTFKSSTVHGALNEASEVIHVLSADGVEEVQVVDVQERILVRVSS